eukprot:ANDGO_07375.mRNA.1 hypothetical protein
MFLGRLIFLHASPVLEDRIPSLSGQMIHAPASHVRQGRTRQMLGQVLRPLVSTVLPDMFWNLNLVRIRQRAFLVLSATNPMARTASLAEPGISPMLQRISYALRVWRGLDEAQRQTVVWTAMVVGTRTMKRVVSVRFARLAMNQQSTETPALRALLGTTRIRQRITVANSVVLDLNRLQISTIVSGAPLGTTQMQLLGSFARHASQDTALLTELDFAICVQLDNSAIRRQGSAAYHVAMEQHRLKIDLNAASAWVDSILVTRVRTYALIVQLVQLL